MRPLGLLAAATLLFAADPFWTRPARTWSDAELDGMFQASPWTQTDKVSVWLASAGPMREAERELRIRRGNLNREFAPDTDFDEFLRLHGHENIVVAVKAQDTTGLLVDEEMDRLKKECRVKSGKRYLQLEGFFPPTKADPVLRLVFERDLDPKAPVLRLELYIPAMDGKAWRNFDFPIAPMMVAGKPEV